jgi:hypothetical protein
MKYFKYLILVVLVMLLFSSCGDIKYANEEAANYVYTFWDGLLHGMLAIPIWIINVFSDTKHAIYATNNNGDWYNLGFILGMSAMTGSSTTYANSGKEKK